MTMAILTSMSRWAVIMAPANRPAQHHHLPPVVRRWPYTCGWIAACVLAELVTGLWGRR